MWIGSIKHWIHQIIDWTRFGLLNTVFSQRATEAPIVCLLGGWDDLFSSSGIHVMCYLLGFVFENSFWWYRFLKWYFPYHIPLATKSWREFDKPSLPTPWRNELKWFSGLLTRGEMHLLLWYQSGEIQEQNSWKTCKAWTSKPWWSRFVIPRERLIHKMCAF